MAIQQRYYIYDGTSNVLIKTDFLSPEQLISEQAANTNYVYLLVARTAPVDLSINTRDWIYSIKGAMEGVDTSNHSGRWKEEFAHGSDFRPTTIGVKITEANKRTRNLHTRHLFAGFCWRVAKNFSEPTLDAFDVGEYTTKVKIDGLVEKLRLEMQIPAIKWWHRHNVIQFNAAIHDRRIYLSKETNGVLVPDYAGGLIFSSPSDADFENLAVNYNKMRGATK